ncbi:MAG: ACP S-malonyltransferase [Clostridiales bacterium]|jgi:[acyl-carrier-protein] S-malonyltransferase|nr:ACP S-malonyltransferase [Clostridiales bacterium]
MSKIAFLFPGQGAQSVGMGKAIAEKYKSSQKIFKLASDVLKLDMENMIFNGDEETLKLTENTQPAILTTSIACLQPLIEAGIKPTVTAGLSLGEYSGHVLAGTFRFETAVGLVRKRGRYMQEAVPEGVGAMAAIIGLEDDAVINCCNAAKNAGIVEAANFNCPGQVTIAGEVAAVERACEIAKENGAKRAVVLPVSAPFHCSLLKPAGEKLATELEKVELGNMTLPLVTNVTAEYVTDSTKVKELLIKQVSSPVYFTDSILNMLKNGIDTFIEIGPGKALSGFVKKISKDVATYNVEDLESLEKTLDGLNT